MSFLTGVYILLCQAFKAQLPAALAFLSAALSDSSPMVLYQTIHTIGRLAHLFPESLGDMIPLFVPKLTALLHTSQPVCDRVRGHAASALINLTNPESCETELVEPFLDPLLAALCSCLQGASLSVQSPCLSLLGCVNHIPYTEHMSFLITTIIVSSDASQRSQRINSYPTMRPLCRASNRSCDPPLLLSSLTSGGRLWRRSDLSGSL